MNDETKAITNGRLLTRFAQLGPYLRQHKCTEDVFFFDCLANCVNAEKSPENREFWGWWLLLHAKEGGFEYSYEFGMYDLNGDWITDNLPEHCTADVKQSLNDYYSKLFSLCDEIGLSLDVKPDAKVEQLG